MKLTTNRVNQITETSNLLYDKLSYGRGIDFCRHDEYGRGEFAVLGERIAL